MELFNYKFIKTKDGTATLHNSEYDEAMHSVSGGAYDESVVKHVRASGILNNDCYNLNILDVGFGLGYNILATLCEILKVKPDARLNIISFEKTVLHLNHLKTIKFNDERDDFYELVKTALEKGECNSKNISIKIILADARESIRKMNNIKFHAIYHDPFSPSKNPELWTTDFFKELIKVLDYNGILTTYSSAPQVRRALLDAGFIIGKGPPHGMKKEGTIAAKSNFIEKLKPEIINELLEEIKSTPFRDMTNYDGREQIIKRRIEEIKFKRSKGCHQAHQG